MTDSPPKKSTPDPEPESPLEPAAFSGFVMMHSEGLLTYQNLKAVGYLGVSDNRGP